MLSKTILFEANIIGRFQPTVEKPALLAVLAMSVASNSVGVLPFCI